MWTASFFLRLLGKRSLRRLLLFVFEQLADDLVNDLVRQSSDFGLGLRLNRMRNQNRLILSHPQRGALRVGRANEFRSGHVCRWDTVFFKVDDIVRTARYAGPSIAEGFNDGITPFAQLHPDRLGCRACDRGLHAP